MRFFIDHGTIHDRQTGKHVCCNDLNEFDIRETVGFLNEQQAAYTAIVEDRNELHRFNCELDKALTESHAENDRLEKERDEWQGRFCRADAHRDELKSELAAAKADVEYYSKQRNEFAAELELAKTEIERQYKIIHKRQDEIYSRDALLEKCEKAMQHTGGRIAGATIGSTIFNTYYRDEILNILSEALAELKAHREARD